MRFGLSSALKAIVAGALGCAAAVLVACGNSNGLLPGDQANKLNSALDGVAAACQGGDVARAQAAASRFSSDVAGLSGSSVDTRLVRELRGGARTLEQLIDETCTEETVPTTTTTVPPPETAPTTPPETTPEAPPETTQTAPPPSDGGTGTPTTPSDGGTGTPTTPDDGGDTGGTPPNTEPGGPGSNDGGTGSGSGDTGGAGGAGGGGETPPPSSGGATPGATPDQGGTP